jgi:hypothetical protein
MYRYTKFGMVSNIKLGVPSGWLTRFLDKGIVVHLVYPHLHNFEDVKELISEKELSEIPDGEILLIGSLEKTNNIIWKRRIESIYLIDGPRSKAGHCFMKIEGESFILDSKTGKLVSDSDDSRLLKWLRADVSGAKGIDEFNAYILKLFGAVNTPKTSYNPKKDKQRFR